METQVIPINLEKVKALLIKGAKVFYNSHGDVCDDTLIKNLFDKDKGQNKYE